MNKQRSVSLLGLALAASLAVAACGSDSDDSSTTDAPADTTAGTTADTTAGTTADTTADTTAGTTGDTTAGSAATGEGVSLAGDCPDTVVIQTDWMPEAEHGFLYQMVGEGYEIDAGKAYVTGPLIDAAGNDTGVKIQIRSGGAAQNFSPVTQIMYADDSVTLGYVYTDEAIQFSGDFPTVAIESGFEKNPQMIMWDPGDLSGRHRHRRPRHRGCQGPLLRWRGVHGLLHRYGHPVGRPGRRLLLGRPEPLHRR